MERKKELKHFRDLEVYQRAFKTAMRIYEITKAFPESEHIGGHKIFQLKT